MTDVNDSPEVDSSIGAATIHDRMIAIADHLPAIGKDSQMMSGRVSYNYRGIDDIMPHVREALATHQVHVLPAYSVIADEAYEVRRDDGSVVRWRHITLLGDFDFTAPDGSSVRVTTIGEGKDSSDKAANKAMTGAYKYALIQAFNISDGEDPDRERAESVSTPAPAAAVTPMGPPTNQGPTPLQVLIAMRDDLVETGRYEAVTAFAVDHNIELVPGAPAEQVQAVVEFAAQQLLEARQAAEPAPEPQVAAPVEEPTPPPGVDGEIIPVDVDETQPRDARDAGAAMEDLAAKLGGTIEDVPLPGGE